MGDGQRWDWLGEPLAVDFANTVKRVGTTYRDLLRSPEDVVSWASHEAGRVPMVDATELEPRLGEVRGVRDDVFAVLTAAAGDDPFPSAAARRLNDRARSLPVTPQLADGPGTVETHVPPGTDRIGELLTRIAHAAIELAARGPDAGLGLCDAPSCGQFFIRDRPNQRWCGPACGTRARVARHAGQHVHPYVAVQGDP
jgi:predicted RNA-binding Zn ribbon-like protein